MPVAALIVVRPGIEVKAIESDSLSADPDRWQARADVAVESVFVHAEVAWGVADLGLRVSRATSCALRIFSQSGNRSLTHRDNTTLCEEADTEARCVRGVFSRFINDLHCVVPVV
jgi:hypothetical protein